MDVAAIYATNYGFRRYYNKKSASQNRPQLPRLQHWDAKQFKELNQGTPEHDRRQPGSHQPQNLQRNRTDYQHQLHVAAQPLRYPFNRPTRREDPGHNG
ncbi:unnamed protein product, partial [Mesorhabditis spiculigera]